MKTCRTHISLLFLLFAHVALLAAVVPRSFDLKGRIGGENIRFALESGYADQARGESLEVLRGEVALTEARLPRHTELRRDGDAFRIVRTGGWRAGEGRVRLAFAVRTVADGDWRQAQFRVPVLPVRSVAVTADRPGLEIRFPGGRGLQRQPDADGRDTVTVHLDTNPLFEVFWKPEIRRVASELVATCDINTIVTASPGMLRFDSIYAYSIAQGQMSELSLTLPDVNILRVTGADIQDWRIDRTESAAPRLRITLGRPQRGEYRLQVEYDRALPAFPCTLGLPVLAPQGVIRAGGQLLLGTDSAVKLQVAAASGITQIDQAAFAQPAPLRDGYARTLPTRSVFTYQYAALPYALTLGADHVVPALSGEIDLLVNVAEGRLALDAAIRLDVRDAPVREVKLVADADPRWTLIGVTGKPVIESDVDVRAEGGRREILVPFRQPVEGQTLLNLRMELPLGLARDAFTVPSVSLPGARTQRGCIVAAAERGIRLVPRAAENLRDVHTGSTPFRAEGAQLAYRFREPGWKLDLGLEWAQSAIHTEIFHLLSLGAGVVYVSAAVNCHISGAPVQTLAFRVPDAGASREIVGAGTDNWARSNDLCRVQLASRTMGHTTLLITYDQPLGYDGAELRIGGIEAVGTASEMGFMAVASGAGLRLEETAPLPPGLIRIPRDELPAGYAATVTAPLLAVYKYTRRPHAATLRVTTLETQRPIDQVVDYFALSSRIGRDGESVTRAACHVKNASRQYLEARLPAGAKLWSVRQGLEANARDLPAQQDGERLLIPVARLRDPNQAVPIEIVYAQPAPAVRQRPLRVGLTAPQLSDTPATFTRWEVTADDNRAIGAAGGNLTPEAGTAGRWPWASPCARRARTVSFYRTANLADEERLRVTVELLPSWMAGGSPRRMVVAGAAGLAALLIGLVLRRRFWLALALTLLALAAAQTQPGLIGVVIAGTVGTAVALIAAIARGIARLNNRSPRERRERKGKTSRVPPPPLVPEPEPDAAPADDAAPGDTSTEGSISPLFLILLAALASLLLAGFGTLKAETEAAPRTEAPAAVAPDGPQVRPALPAAVALPPALAADRLEVEIEAPPATPEAEPVAEVRWTLVFRADAPGRRLLLPPGSVVAGFRADAARLRLVSHRSGVQLDILKAGEHRLEITTREQVWERDGGRRLLLPWPSNLINRLALTIPTTDMEVEIPSAASLDLESADGATRVEATLTATDWVEIAWKPRARDTRMETAVVYADVASLARLRPGVIEMQSLVSFTIVQGETREFALTAPAGMTVTAVAGPLLATWRFDPADRSLGMTLSRPASGTLTLTVILQSPCGGLPYDGTLGVPAAIGVGRQRGRIALAAPEDILARIGDVQGVSPIDTDDFSLAAFAAERASSVTTLRRAFRYDDPAAVRIALHAEEVQPEIRVSEASLFSIGDERTILSGTLEVSVAKAGLFALHLDLPEGYEIESLTGRDVSHWDDSRRGGQQGVEVFLTRRVQDTTSLNLVLSQQQRGVPPQITVPRVQVRGALRHSGRISVAAERGVKLVTGQIEGAVARRPGDETRAPAGALHFDLLRPGWQIGLQTEVLAPVLKPEVLHCVDLAEGMLLHRIHARYRIENAGVKVFRVRVPVAEAPVTVSGRGIARVRPLDDVPAAVSNGTGRIWEIELHGKVEDSFSLVCQYQEPYDPAGGGVVIRPFEPLDTARQSGFLVITGGGRVQVEPRGEPAGLKPEDARALPDSFGAGDLSGALRCYRVLRPDYRLELSVVRHAAAAVLPAQVRQVRLVTVLSGSGRLLTQATITLQPGSLRHLRVILPGPSNRLWSALVNGGEAPVAREKGAGGETLSIALEGVAREEPAHVTLVYADALPEAGLDGCRELQALRLPDLPLRDIQWRLFVPAEYRWRLRGGDLDLVDSDMLRSFGKSAYETAVQQAQAASLTAARGNLQSLDTLLKAGRQLDARHALQQAGNLSQGEQALNEDARVQFRNVVRQQVKMGLVNRRQALRAEKNIYDEGAPQAQVGWNNGNFDERYVRQVEEQLDAADRDNLERVADKMVEQQVQAASAATAIRIAMPEHGREICLSRALLNTGGGTLRVVFEAQRRPAWMRLLGYWPLLLVFAGAGIVLRLALGSARRGRRR